MQESAHERRDPSERSTTVTVCDAEVDFDQPIAQCSDCTSSRPPKPSPGRMRPQFSATEEILKENRLAILVAESKEQAQSAGGEKASPVSGSPREDEHRVDESGQMMDALESERSEDSKECEEEKKMKKEEEEGVRERQE